MFHNFFKKYLSLKLFFFLILITSLIIALKGNQNPQINPAYASPTDEGGNVSGFAWSSNIGIISFNFRDCDLNGNGTYEAGEGAPGCPFSPSPAFNYSVDISTSSNVSVKGNLSGVAWSNSVGWISFDRATCSAGANVGNRCYVNGDCPGGTCSESGPGAAGDPPANAGGGILGPTGTISDPIAKLSSNNIYGWAKIMSMGSDGWIRFDDNNGGDGINYGVTIPNLGTAEFRGFAWNGNTNGSGIGFIGFNCLDYGDCTNEPYAVVADINQPPILSSLTAPNWNISNACQYDLALRADLSFQFSDPEGDTVNAVQLHVDRTDGPSFDTGECISKTNVVGGAAQAKCGGFELACFGNSSGPCTYTLSRAYWTTGTDFDYDKHYEWEVRMRDSVGAWSEFKPYDTTPDTDNNDGVALTFTTYKRKFPEPFFTWFPTSPSTGENVKFSAQPLSTFYSTGVSTQNCNGSNLCNYTWSVTGCVPGPNPTPVPDTGGFVASSTVITIDKSCVVNLSARFVDGADTTYTCSTSSPAFDQLYRIPIWQETN